MSLDIAQIVSFLSSLSLFAGLTPEQLAFIAQRMSQQNCVEDEVIFEQGENAGSLYLIYGGRLQANRYTRGARRASVAGQLDQGDLLGQEVLEMHMKRQVTVTAVTQATLLRLSMKALIEITRELPDLLPRLDLIRRSYLLSLRAHMDWVSPEEAVHFVARRHPILMWARLAPLVLVLMLVVGTLLAIYSLNQLPFLLVILAALLLGGGLTVAWIAADWGNDYYIVTSRRVVAQERVLLLYDSRQESPVEQVQSTETASSYMGRMLNYGDVRIRTYTGLITFRGVRDPQTVEAVVQEHVRRNQSVLRKAEIETIEETIARRIGMLPADPTKPGVAPASDAPQTPAVQPAPLQYFLADLFHLRYEYGGTIQYRTHWWILWRRIWLKSLLLLLAAGGMAWLIIASSRGNVAEGFPVLAVFLGLCLAGLGLTLWWVYTYLDWHNDVYLITNEQVVDLNRKPLGLEERRAAPIKNILSVEYKRLGIMGLLLNFGTVEIKVGDSTLTFDYVYNPSDVQRELFNRMAQRSVRERQAQADAERERMAEWIGVYHRLTKGEKP